MESLSQVDYEVPKTNHVEDTLLYYNAKNYCLLCLLDDRKSSFWLFYDYLIVLVTAESVDENPLSCTK